MLLVTAAVAVAGVVTLWIMAQRYQRMAEMRSLEEIEASSRIVPESSAPTDAAPEAVETVDAVDTVVSERQREIDALVTVRAGIREVLDEEPGAKRWIDRDTEKFRSVLQPHAERDVMRIMTRVRLRRLDDCERVGISEEQYMRVRDAYRSWQDGGEVDAELAEAFDSRRSDLEGIGLGLLEPYDL